MGDLIENKISLYERNKKLPTNEDLKRWKEANNYQSLKYVLNPIGFLGFSGSGLGTGVNKKLN